MVPKLTSGFTFSPSEVLPRDVGVGDEAGFGRVRDLFFGSFSLPVQPSSSSSLSDWPSCGGLPCNIKWKKVLLLIMCVCVLVCVCVFF